MLNQNIRVGGNFREQELMNGIFMDVSRQNEFLSGVISSRNDKPQHE